MKVLSLIETPKPAVTVQFSKTENQTEIEQNTDPNRTEHVHTTTVCKTLPVNTNQITDLKFEHKASMSN